MESKFPIALTAIHGNGLETSTTSANVIELGVNLSEINEDSFAAGGI